MKNRRNYYRVLQVQPDAPTAVIRAAYRALMLELKQHPDLGGSPRNALLINEAYEVLSDARRRLEYDRELYYRCTGRRFSPGRRALIELFCPFCKRPLAFKPQPGEKCSSCRSPLLSGRPASVQRDCRRSVSRMDRHEKVRYQASWPGRALDADMVDLSPRGMRFICSERLQPGTPLRVTCRIFDASGIVTNTCQIEVDGECMFSVGVSFSAVQFADSRGSFLSDSA